MNTLYFSNTYFEEELLSHSHSSTIESYLSKHPIYIQLEFLSFLFGRKEGLVLLSHKPEPAYLARLASLGIDPPRYDFLSKNHFQGYSLNSWGPSLALYSWAKQHHVDYPIPDWSLVREVNSKAFSFLHTSPLPGSCLLQDEQQALHWWEKTPCPKVLKSVYGVSGRGHWISTNPSIPFEHVLPFLRKQWALSLPILAEPWVDRVLDFSTQWEIHRDGSYSYIGSTLCKNNRRGIYQSNLTGPEDRLFQKHLPYLKQHLLVADEMIRTLSQKGYFGNIGLDAMLYKHPADSSHLVLHPIVEINARKTMGWIALQLHAYFCPHSILSLCYQPDDEKHNLLPSFVFDLHEKKIPFEKKLVAKIIDTKKP